MPLSDAEDDAADAAKTKAGQTDDLLKQIPGMARDAQKKLMDGVEQVRGQINDLDMDDINERLGGARSFITERVTDKPVAATVAAVGAGFLIGLMFAGKRR